MKSKSGDGERKAYEASPAAPLRRQRESASKRAGKSILENGKDYVTKCLCALEIPDCARNRHLQRFQ